MITIPVCTVEEYGVVETTFSIALVLTFVVNVVTLDAVNLRTSIMKSNKG